MDTSNSKGPKLSVYTDREMMRRLRREKLETERPIQEIVNQRLRLSYELHPDLQTDHAAVPAPA